MEHVQIASRKRNRPDEEGDKESYPPLERSNVLPDNWNSNHQETGFSREESLKRSDAIPVTTVSKRNLFSHQALAPRSQPFKFKHPFCMLVAGPSRSGKTQWVVKLLKQRHQRIEPPVDGIVFCYAHWQDKYDELKRAVPATHFHQGLPSSETMSLLREGILVLDDLMEEAVKDPNIMSMFTVGSHHKNISVVFLMQNMYQKGSYTRIMSMNTQYMVLLKNARDRQQIKTLASQMYPNRSK